LTARGGRGSIAEVSDQLVFVVTTVSSDAEARAVADHLVGGRFAACVNALPGVRSVYSWKGKVEEAGEILLLVKTLESRLDDVKRALREIHPYELPEVVALRAADVDEAFARWVAESCATGGRESAPP
jgi:periplasmic divalent cation tolerance protein